MDQQKPKEKIVDEISQTAVQFVPYRLGTDMLGPLVVKKLFVAYCTSVFA